jgi:hypothetical protein
MITSDKPPHLTSPRRGEGFFLIFAERRARDEGGYNGMIVDPAIVFDFAIALLKKLDKRNYYIYTIINKYFLNSNMNRKTVPRAGSK